MQTCTTCGGPCEEYEGETYCPDCDRFAPAALLRLGVLLGLWRPALLGLLLAAACLLPVGTARAANQTVQILNRSGITDLDTTAVNSDAGGTDSWTSGSGYEYVYVNNSGGSPITVTLNFNTALTVDGQTPPNRTVTVGAGKRALIGPFPTTLYNSGTQNTVTIAWSATTSVKVLVFRVNPNQ